jgi:hypothetical protein
LENINVYITLTMKEGVFTINMKNKEIVSSSKSEDNMDGFDSDDKSESLIEVQTYNLEVTFDNNSYFILFEIDINVTFNLKDLL